MAMRYLGFDHVEFARLLGRVREEVRSDLQHGGCLVVNDVWWDVSALWLHALLNDVLQLWTRKQSNKVKLFAKKERNKTPHTEWRKLTWDTS